MPVIQAIRLAGRCANGHEGGKGTRLHAKLPGAWQALCKREPGRRSAGWSSYPETADKVDCPDCLRIIGLRAGFARSRLKDAIDRKQRAETQDAWLSDEASIERALSDLEELGFDRMVEWQNADAKVQERNADADAN